MRRLKAEREARAAAPRRRREEPITDLTTDDRFEHLVEALAIRGDMIKAGAVDRVVLQNRVAALEAENAALRRQVALFERDA